MDGDHCKNNSDEHHHLLPTVTPTIAPAGEITRSASSGTFPSSASGGGTPKRRPSDGGGGVKRVSSGERIREMHLELKKTGISPSSSGSSLVNALGGGDRQISPVANVDPAAEWRTRLPPLDDQEANNMNWDGTPIQILSVSPLSAGESLTFGAGGGGAGSAPLSAGGASVQFHQQLEELQIQNDDEVDDDTLDIVDLIPSVPLDDPGPVTIIWHSLDANTVHIGGSFNSWIACIALTRTKTDFRVRLALPPGYHMYKFLVDGEWMVDDLCPIAYDSAGNANNWLRVGPTEQSVRETSDRLVFSSKSTMNLLQLAISPSDRRPTMGKNESKLVLAMVGLPARGKTYIAKRLERWLRWMGYSTRIFNVGNYRREILGAKQDATFFDPTNEAGSQQRKLLALRAMEDMFNWMDTENGHVAIFDATNTTKDRRRQVAEMCNEHKISTIFIESVCNDQSIIESNVRENKLSSPDYMGVDPSQAQRDFLERIQQYARVYEPMQEEGLSWIKLVDVGKQLVTNHIYGFLPWKLTLFVANLQITPRPIFLTRAGESVDSSVGKLGGDSGLTANGRDYANRFARFIEAQILRQYPSSPPLIWTSSLRRTKETIAPLVRPPLCLSFCEWKALDSIDVGEFHGKTKLEAVKLLEKRSLTFNPEILTWRYPRGESFQDVIHRMEPVIIEVERQRSPVVIVAHQAVLQALYSYFMGINPDSAPTLDIPYNQVIQLTPKAYGCVEERHTL